LPTKGVYRSIRSTFFSFDISLRYGTTSALIMESLIPQSPGKAGTGLQIYTLG
jgi:hypothetical protein